MYLLYYPSLNIILGTSTPPSGIFFLAGITYILLLIFLGKKNKKIDEEVEYIFYSKWHRLTKDNLMVAYIRLAALLIDDDRSEAGKKVIYMNKYFFRYFPENQVHFSDMFTDSLHNKVKLSSVGTWLNRKLPAKKDRLQIMYFLAGVTKIDGFVNSKELKTLQTIADLLEITPKEFRTVLGIYNQQTNSKKKATIPTKSKRIIAFEILGISEFAKMDEIKKAYRKLVKIHHPDRFYNESTAQQEIAEERFLAIQKAYETLEKIF